jgi:hypothetical protein
MRSAASVLVPAAVAAVWLAACADRTPVSPPEAAPPAGAAARMSCVVSVHGGTLDCSGGAAGVRANIIGGQGTYVQLKSSNVAFDSASGTLRADVTVQNLLPYALGVGVGWAHDSAWVRVFFDRGPTTTAGTGAVTVQNPSGLGTFTASNQPYFSYLGPLEPGWTSGVETWRFHLDPGVTEFSFQLYVQARVAPSAFRVFAPEMDDTLERGSTVGVRVRAGAPPSVGSVAARLGAASTLLAYAGDGVWEGTLPLSGLSPGTQGLQVVARSPGDSTVQTTSFEIRANPGEPTAVAIGSLSEMSENGVVVGTLELSPRRPYRWSQAGGLESLPPGIGSSGIAISPNGRFVVGRAGYNSGFMWTADGDVYPIPGLPYGGVNDAGVAAGTVYAGGFQRLFRWTTGGMELSQFPVDAALGITANGAVIGQTISGCVELPSLRECSNTTPLLWTPAGGMFPGSEDGMVALVHSSGWAVGSQCLHSEPGESDAGKECWPAIWHVTATSLQGPVIVDEPGLAVDVNSSGVASAVYWERTGSVRMARWAPPRNPELLDLLGDQNGTVRGINENGDITGCTEDASGRRRAVVWKADGTVRRLPTLAGDTESCGVFIDGSGTVVGTSTVRRFGYWFERVARWPSASPAAAPAPAPGRSTGR